MTWSIKYGLKQKGSFLKVFTVFLVVWFCFLGMLVLIFGIMAVIETVNEKEDTPGAPYIMGMIVGILIIWILCQIFFVGPLYLIQFIWTRTYRKRIESTLKGKLEKDNEMIQAKLNKQRWEEEERRRKELEQLQLIEQQREEEVERKKKLEQEVAQAKLIKQQREEAERRQMEQKRLQKIKEEQDLQMAKNYEVALRYDDAIRIYEKYGQWQDAGRVRRLQQGKPVETVMEY